MKKIIFGCLLLGSCMVGSGDFQSEGNIFRVMGLFASLGNLTKEDGVGSSDGDGNNQTPPSLYPKSPYTLLQGLTISSQTPSYSGTITGCSSNPRLPNGLSLSNACVISGTPTATVSMATYTITASIPTGQISTTLLLSIESPNNYIVSMPTGLLKTGQTTSYVAGDDGDLQKGVARTFITGGTSGLIWQRCAAGLNSDATCSGDEQSYNWNDANTYCNSLSLGGRSWRLPTIIELRMLVQWTGSSLYIDSIFQNKQRQFWSSNSYLLNSSNVWFYDFGNMNSCCLSKSSDAYVRCIIE